MKNQETLIGFGLRLKQIRVDKDFTQLRLSELSGVSNVQIARYENAITRPSPKSVKKLSAALGVKFEDIAGDYFYNQYDSTQLDASIERLKRLPIRDILLIKEIIDCYVGFKEVSSSVHDILY